MRPRSAVARGGLTSRPRKAECVRAAVAEVTCFHYQCIDSTNSGYVSLYIKCDDKKQQNERKGLGVLTVD